MNNIVAILFFHAVSFYCFGQQSIVSDSAKIKSNRFKPKISGALQVHSLEELNTNGDTVRDPTGFRILRARLIAKGDLNEFVSYELMVS